MKRRILSFLLAGILVCYSMNSGIPTQAAEIMSETETEVIETEDLLQLQETVINLQKEQVKLKTVTQSRKSVKEETGSPFAMKTLIVTATGVIDTAGANTVIKSPIFDTAKSNNLYVLLYDTEKATQNAYDTLLEQAEAENSSVHSVTVDAVTSVAGTVETVTSEDKKAQVETDSGESESTEPEKSKLQQYIEKNHTDTTIKVAIIDTGFDKTSTDDVKTSERIIDTGLNLSTSGESGDTQDDNGHGTQLTQLILKETPENIKLLPIKAANANGQATVLGIYLAIQEAVKLDADVILLSMNGKNGGSPLLQEVIQQAANKDISVVVSAGNYGMDASGCVPADVKEAIIISAVEDGTLAEYSNYGETVDFCADGAYETIDNEGKKITLHGTSFSAAYAAARIASIKTFLSEEDSVEEVLSLNVQDLGRKGVDKFFGKGYIGEYYIEDTSDDGEKDVEDNNSENDVPENDNGDSKSDEDDLLETQFTNTSGYFKVTVFTPDGEWGRYKISVSVGSSSETKAQTPTYEIETESDGSAKLDGSSDNFSGKFTLTVTHNKTTPDDSEEKNYNMFEATLTISPKGDTVNNVKGYHIEKKDIKIQGELTGHNHSGWGDISGNTISLTLASNSLGMNNGCGSNCTCHPIFRFNYTVNTYKITYDKQGGTGTLPDGEVTYNNNYTINSTVLTKTGYTFKGYYLKRPNGNVWGGMDDGWVSSTEKDKFLIYQPGGTTTFGPKIGGPTAHNGKFTFVATWKKNTYTVAYNNGNAAATGTMISHTVDYGNAFTIKSCDYTLPGYEFAGYYVVRQSDAKVYCSSTGTWKALSEVTTADYGIFNGGIAATMGTTWINTAAGNDTFTFYAIWRAKAFTVTYDANGGKIVSTGAGTYTQSVTAGSAIALNVSAVHPDSNYRFVGWAVAGSKVPLTSLQMGTGNVTLYALYSTPVSDVAEVYLKVGDNTGKESKNGNKYETYQLTKTADVSSPVHGYCYKLNRMDYESDFPNSQASDMAAAIYAVDYAGNSSLIKSYTATTIPPDKTYPQTVSHMFQNLDTDSYENNINTSEEMREGQEYTPVQLPVSMTKGYTFNNKKSTDINKTYVVAGAKTVYAYYDIIEYTLTFDPAGGAFDSMEERETTSKPVYFGKSYDYLPGNIHAGFPQPTKEGYTFLGWYTQPQEGGTPVYPNTKYELESDSTIYAHWKINSYEVVYDYWTNGGTEADKFSDTVNYGAEVDLSVTAKKEGWEHIGWHTDANATVPLEEPFYMLDVPERKLTLYAIYKKDITVTYIDQTDTETITRTKTQTIYNLEKGITITLPELNQWAGWKTEGWCIPSKQEDGAEKLPDAETPVSFMTGAILFTDNDITFYGKYSREVTVSYDTNGSLQEIEPETKIRYYNASDSCKNPVFTLAAAPSLPQNSFVSWVKVQTEDNDAEIGLGNQAGQEYAAGQTVEFEEDTLLVARWDEYPKIEAYDCYFTLEEAQNGDITPTVLLENVKGTDYEDGSLTNGADVLVINYSPEEFTGFTTDGSVSVTYQATDSFGNVVTKMVMAHIVDTAPQDSKIQSYIRFINGRFYKAGEEYVTSDKGGLEENSIWKENPVYAAALNYAMSNEKRNETVVNQEFMGAAYEITKPGTGIWEHKVETWTFTKEQIQEVKQFITDSGYGKYQKIGEIGEFCQQFSGCLE